MTVAGLLARTLLLASVAGGTDPDLRFVFSNQCPYPVRFYSTVNIGPVLNGTSLVVIVNEMLKTGQELTHEVASARLASAGRIYLYSTEPDSGEAGDSPVPIDQQDQLFDLMFQSSQQVYGSDAQKVVNQKIQSAFISSLRSSQPSQEGQMLEFTIQGVDDKGVRIYDVDISDVDAYSHTVSADMLYDHGGTFDTSVCFNMTNALPADEASCNKVSQWRGYPAERHIAGPAGQCVGASNACAGIGATRDVCKLFDSELQPLFDYLVSHKEETGFVRMPDTTPSGQMYGCVGFPNTATYLLAAMCSAINRGQCPMPIPADLATPGFFDKWVQKECGGVQASAPTTTWFTHDVYNPYAKYVRQTLKSTAYSFSQDEGLNGGNSQCRGDPALKTDAPTGVRFTACPKSSDVENILV